MVSYKCNTCKKQFTHKNDYRKHKNRKNPCSYKSETNTYSFECPECKKTYTSKSNLNRHIRNQCPSKISRKNNEYELGTPQIYNLHTQSIPKTTKTYDLVKQPNPNIGFCVAGNVENCGNNICDYCGKKFSRHDAMMRHIKNSCKVKKQSNEEKEEIYQKLLQQLNEENKEMKEENREMKDELQKLRQHITINNTNTNNNNSHNTNNNNIQINNEIKLIGFGDEDLYSINDKVVKKLLNKGLNSVLETIRYTHFHKYNIHHHNVYVSNMKDVYAMIYSGDRNKWIIEQKKEVVDQLYNDKHLFLEDKYKQLYDDLPPLTRKKFDKLLELSDDEETVRIIKREILEMLYNEKDIPLRTRKKIEQLEKESTKMIES